MKQKKSLVGCSEQTQSEPQEPILTDSAEDVAAQYQKMLDGWYEENKDALDKMGYDPRANHNPFLAEKNLALYDVHAHWDLILPVIKRRQVQKVLNQTMRELASARTRMDKTGVVYRWEEGSSPYLWSNCWMYDNAPERDTVEWYQIQGNCWSMAKFCLAIGRELFPDRKWAVRKSNRHAVAAGVDDNGHTLMIELMDRRYLFAEQVYDFADPNMSDEDYSAKWDRDLEDMQKEFDEHDRWK